MSTSLGNIHSQIDKDVDRPEEIEGKVDDHKLTPERARENNHHSRNGIPVNLQSQTALVATEEIRSQREWWGARHTMAFLSLLGIAMMFSMRINLSVAIVSMVEQQPKNITNTSDMSQVCLPPDGYDTSEQGNEKGEFDWDEATQGHILGAFYYGYLVGNFVGGIAAEHFGGKLVFGWGVVLTGIFTLLSPFCAKVSTGLFIAIRVFEGLSQGFMFPTVNCLLGKWIPPVERTKFTSTVYAGAQVGIVVTMPVSGWLCDTDFLGGWPSVFYVFGSLGIIWGIPWYFLVYSTPDLHPRISVAEKSYISKSCISNNDKAIPIPWKAIFTSTPFWAILVAHVGFNWGYLHLLAMLPSYLKNIQNFDMTSNGILSALPYLIMWIFSMVYGNFMSYLQEKGKLSTITIRRLAMAISMYGPMVALVAMCFVNCNQVLAMVVICIAVGLCGSVYSGSACSHQDIAPNLGGTLMGFTCGFATLSGFLAPGITGWIINQNQTLSAWRVVFLISSAIYMIAGTIYIIFVSTEIQPWNFPKVKSNNKADESSIALKASVKICGDVIAAKIKIRKMNTMCTSLGNIRSQINKTIAHHEEIRKIEDKVDDYKLTPEEEKDNAKSESIHHSSRDGIAVNLQSRTALVDTEEMKSQLECWGTRHTMGFLSLLGIAMMFSMRVNLSVAIVSMVKRQPRNITNTSDMSQVCLPPDGYDTSEQGNEIGEFDWDEATQGHILGAFYYGYLVGNFFGGIAAENFGGKLIFGWGVVLTGIFTLLSPLCAKVSTGLFITIRVFEGLSQGIMYPAINCLLAKWIPPVERTKFTSAVYSGAQVGIVVTMPVSGWLCDTDFLGGWPSVFYVSGALGIIWGIPWYFLVYSTPDLHPRISVAENAYISQACVSNNDKAIPIPWKAIFTSTPFWAILVGHGGFNWGYLLLLSMLPTYLKNIQHFDMTSNGILSALPYLIMWIFSMFYGNFMSYLQVNGKLSTITIRRLAMAISMYGPMVALVAMCFVNCNQVLAMVVICISVGISGAVYCGCSCSHQDIAPNLGGTLMGFTCGFATLSGFLAPSVTGWIINRNQTLSAWRTVFLISSAIYMLAGTIYIVFVSTEIQPWNFPKVKSNDKAEVQEKTRF